MNELSFKHTYELYVTKHSLLSPEFKLFVLFHDQDLRSYCLVKKPDDNLTRGCRNFNPFNIRKSGSQWLGKLKGLKLRQPRVKLSSGFLTRQYERKS